MPKLFLLFSHSLTEEQKKDAQQHLGITDFVCLPTHLQQLFSNIPPDLEQLDDYLQPIVDWINENCSNAKDYILIQGDFGATYRLVNYCKKANYATPIYATTARQAIENLQPDGTVIVEKIFKHIRFRHY